MKLSYVSLIITLILVSCAKKTEVELLKAGQAAEQGKNFKLAIDCYQELTDRFPSAASAESCQTRVAVIYNNELHDAGNAVAAYKKVYARFPLSKNAPAALFLCGFLWSNELHNTDSAKVVYETFLQKYPDHELAASAKFELETLGKSPDQLIQPEKISGDDQKPQSTEKPAAQ